MREELWSSDAIVKATQGKATGAFTATGVSIDSRTVEPGDLFVALKGPNFDGHDFVKAALEKGAAGALISQDISETDKVIRVADVFNALERLGAASRARTSAKVIAVTGSVGKTGCKEALRQVLSAQAPTFANQGSFNNHWGVPLSLSRMPASAKYGVFEIGMNHPDELGPLSCQVKPHAALITNIAAVHIGNFKDLNAIATAKAEIFEGVTANGGVVLNADDAYFDFLQKAAKELGIKKIFSFGRAVNADAKLEDAILSADDSVVRARILGKTLDYRVGVPGEHWVINSLAVLLSAALVGADMEEAAEALENLALPDGRGVQQKIVSARGEFTLIDESYNASPVAVEMAVKVLARKIPGAGGRRLLALGDMRELGDYAKDLHVELAPLIASSGISSVFCCGEIMKHLYDALPDAIRGAYAATSAELAPRVAENIRGGDIITVKGSKTTAMYKVADALLALGNTHSPSKRAAG
jgi:UDP-N-acetylmuramoyl-tripeptide--D-alanyl-D-alanine ligase